MKVENYGPKWEKAHTDFANAYYNGRRKRTTPEYLYWKFRGKQGESLPSFLVAVDGDKVVGQVGLVPCDILLNGTIYPAQWICDIMVSHEYRGKGIAAMLYQEAVSRKITLGSDPSPSATKSLAKFGFKDIKGPAKLFFPLWLNAVTDKKVKALSMVMKFIPNPLLLVNIFKKKSIDLEQKRPNQLQESDIFFLSEYKNAVRINRDVTFYQWRLGSFKDYQSEGAIVKDKKNTLFLVQRGSKTNLFFADLHFNKLKDAKSAIIKLVWDAFRQGKREVNTMTGNTNVLKLLKSLGFIQYRTPTHIIYYSTDAVFLEEMAKCDYFEYTYLDSDENI